MKTIKKAVKFFKTQAELAKKIGVRADHVYKCLIHNRLPSIKMAQKIEEVTEGKVKAIDILNEKMQIKLKAMQGKVK